MAKVATVKEARRRIAFGRYFARHQRRCRCYGNACQTIRRRTWVCDQRSVANGRYTVAGSQKTGKRGKPSIVYTYNTTTTVDQTASV